MRRDFIANVSHELKTPLTVIAGFVETMQDLELDARQRTRYLALMHEQARNMQRLVGDLLTLSSLEGEHRLGERGALRDPAAAARGVVGRQGAVRQPPRRRARRARRGRGHRQPRRAGERVRQPRVERGALHARRRPHRAGLAHRAVRRGRVLGDRLGHRHREGAPAAADRALLPRRPLALARDRRHRAGPRDRQARADPSPGRARHRERAGRGQHVLGGLPARRVQREADGDEDGRDAAPTSTAAPRGTGS